MYSGVDKYQNHSFLHSYIHEVVFDTHRCTHKFVLFTFRVCHCSSHAICTPHLWFHEYLYNVTVGKWQRVLLHAHLCIIQMRDDNPMLNLITSHFLLLFLESTHWGLLYSQLWMKLLSDSTSIRGTLFIWILEYIPREEEWIFKEAWKHLLAPSSGAIPPAHQQLLLMIIHLDDIASGERVTAAKKECPHSSTWAHLHSILGTNPKRLQHMHIWIQFYFNDVLHIYVCGSIQFCNLEIICFCVAVYTIIESWKFASQVIPQCKHQLWGWENRNNTQSLCDWVQKFHFSLVTDKVLKNWAKDLRQGRHFS